MTSVRDAMTPGVQAASTMHSLADAAVMMKENDVGSVPVVDEGHLVGIVTDRDIVLRVAEGADPKKVTVGDAASRDLVTVEADQNLDDALHLMAAHQVRRLPVVEGGRLVGMIAQADVALIAKEKQAGEMLEGISEPSSAARA